MWPEKKKACWTAFRVWSFVERWWKVVLPLDWIEVIYICMDLLPFFWSLTKKSSLQISIDFDTFPLDVFPSCRQVWECMSTTWVVPSIAFCCCFLVIFGPHRVEARLQGLVADRWQIWLDKVQQVYIICNITASLYIYVYTVYIIIISIHGTAFYGPNLQWQWKQSIAQNALFFPGSCERQRRIRTPSLKSSKNTASNASMWPICEWDPCVPVAVGMAEWSWKWW